MANAKEEYLKAKKWLDDAAKVDERKLSPEALQMKAEGTEKAKATIEHEYGRLTIAEKIALGLRQRASWER